MYDEINRKGFEGDTVNFEVPAESAAAKSAATSATRTTSATGSCPAWRGGRWPVGWLRACGEQHRALRVAH